MKTEISYHNIVGSTATDERTINLFEPVILRLQNSRKFRSQDSFRTLQKLAGASMCPGTSLILHQVRISGFSVPRGVRIAISEPHRELPQVRVAPAAAT